MLDAYGELSRTGAVLTPIMSGISAGTDTRFGTAADFRTKLERITSAPVITTIKEAEPIGPRGLLDLLIVCPCTGNTLAKLAGGITDSSVTMAVKAHLRNERPVLIGMSTNDALGTAARNIGALLNAKHIFFIPAAQDDPEKKPRSVVADFSRLIPAAEAALDGVQLQPVFG